jgi:hypothetical protein
MSTDCFQPDCFQAVSVTDAMRTAGEPPLAGLLQAVRRLLASTSGPKEPLDAPTQETIWNDPALWMLMMH